MAERLEDWHRVAPESQATSLLMDVPASGALALLTTLPLLAKLLRLPHPEEHIGCVPTCISGHRVFFVPCVLHVCIFIVFSIQTEVQTVLTDELNVCSQQNTVGCTPW